MASRAAVLPAAPWVAAAVLVPAGLATAAAVRPAPFRGETQYRRPVRFDATDRQVRRFEIVVAYLCSDGDVFSVTERDFPPVRLRRGRFGARFRSADRSGTFLLEGRVGRARASGSFSAVRRFDASNQPSRTGAVSCRSRQVHWTAERR